MIPFGYLRLLHRNVLYQHCRGYDPELLCSHSGLGHSFVVWCPVCEHISSGPTEQQAVSDWNDHCIARLSAGKGT